MSEAAIEALESEAYEGEGYGEAAYEGEASYEGEGYGEAAYEAYGEDARSDARRRGTRQQRILAARQRQAQLRRLPAPSPRRPAVSVPGQPQAMTAVRSLDRDMKAELASLRRQLAKARRNGDLANYSAVLSTFASQGIDTFGDRLQKHDAVKAVIRTAPLALLWPQQSRKGIEGILLHPAFIGAAGVAAIFVSGKLVNASHDVDSIAVDGPDTISVKTPAPLTAVASDRKGNQVTVDFTWSSTDGTIATVDQTGLVTGVVAGKGVFIEARGGGAAGRKFVTITP